MTGKKSDAPLPVTVQNIDNSNMLKQKDKLLELALKRLEELENEQTELKEENKKLKCQIIDLAKVAEAINGKKVKG